MNAIVSVTSDWGIGREGRLVVRNRADMRRFVELTMGGTVLMGRTTFESLPAGPLKGRRNVVVTHDATYANRHAGIECAGSIEEALELVSSDDPDTVWLIGGEILYRELLPHCTRAYVTQHETQVAADAYFPNLDEDDAWKLASTEGTGVTEDGVPYAFCVYHRR